ncbi:MAG: A24 family peptidase [Clostridiales Family XIII bacterium]|jgi:prepilin signal peptidase PulO-like enzyme (type II secretory pathway)|nr:A24 family peptidase [Clostridiales Family XIII bacterium]
MDGLPLMISLFAAAIGAGVLAGYGAVYVFNRIPSKWLCDYGEAPGERHLPPRISRRPWGWLFALIFTVSICKIGYMVSWYYAAAALPALWLLLLIGISDRKYKIIPDQFAAALAVVGIGFAAALNYNARVQGGFAAARDANGAAMWDANGAAMWDVSGAAVRYGLLSPLMGAVIGAGILFLIGISGKLMLKKDVMGFGDVKLAGACGLILGAYGIIAVLLMTALSSASVFAAGLLTGKINAGSEEALGPFIAGTTAVYLIFSQEIARII